MFISMLLFYFLAGVAAAAGAGAAAAAGAEPSEPVILLWDLSLMAPTVCLLPFLVLAWRLERKPREMQTAVPLQLFQGRRRGLFLFDTRSLFT